MGIWWGLAGCGCNTGTMLSHIKSSNFNGVVIYSLAMLFVGRLATRPLENTYLHF